MPTAYKTYLQDIYQAAADSYLAANAVQCECTFTYVPILHTLFVSRFAFLTEDRLSHYNSTFLLLLKRMLRYVLSNSQLQDWTSPEALPVHVSFIMDGNGRWAKRRGDERTAGHRAGSETVQRIVRESRRLGIKHMTLYTFSRENWARPQKEVSFLFELLVSFLKKELPDLMEQDIKLNIFGEINELPLAARTALQHAIKKTQKNTSMTLNLALNYSGRDEIIRAAKQLVADSVTVDDVTEENFAARLYSSGIPDPDLMIRTSGEVRLSNFMLFQHAYSEMYFTETLWPDFSVEEFHDVLRAYAARERRFGKTGDQLNND
jgi:undecaprenyl diphosphate synthase